MNYILKYGTKKHTTIREALRERILYAERGIAENSTRLADAEEGFMAYVKETEVDARRRVKRTDGKPQLTTIAIPYSYAILMSWHTYIVSVFLARDPVMQFMGRHGESEQQIQMVEALMGYQTQVGGHLVPYYIWFMDVGKYGIGVMGNYWDKEITQVSEIVEEPITYLGISLAGKTRKVKKTRRVTSYEGNRLFNVRPQDFLYDKRVSLANFQEGEFCGWKTTIGWNQIVKRGDTEQYYNLDVLKKKLKTVAPHTLNRRDTGTPHQTLPDDITNYDALYQFESVQTPQKADIVELSVELIPKDWGLGASTYPETWVFSLANDEVIIESQPHGSLHGKFPFNVLEYEIEGYAATKKGLLDLLTPLNETMTWLFNTHFYNVRDVLNGQFVLDPSRVIVKDFKSEGGGRIIRLKPTAYGQDIRSVVEQLKVTDTTATHMRDTGVVGELMQRVSGVTENIMGMVNSGGRKTATEVRSSNSFGANRLKTQAEYFSAMGFAPQAQMLLQNTQQYYEEEKVFRIAGDLLQEASQFLSVTPEMIAGFYDFVPVDGTMPVDRYAQVTMWTQLMAQLRNFPQIAEQYDFGRIFAWVAQLGGLKNIQRFKIQVLPNEDIRRGAAAGNLIPIGGNVNGGKATGAGTASENSSGVQGATQNPGMGPTG